MLGKSRKAGPRIAWTRSCPFDFGSLWGSNDASPPFVLYTLSTERTNDAKPLFPHLPQTRESTTDENSGSIVDPVFLSCILENRRKEHRRSCSLPLNLPLIRRSFFGSGVPYIGKGTMEETTRLHFRLDKGRAIQKLAPSFILCIF